MELDARADGSQEERARIVLALHLDDRSERDRRSAAEHWRFEFFEDRELRERTFGTERLPLREARILERDSSVLSLLGGSRALTSLDGGTVSLALRDARRLLDPREELIPQKTLIHPSSMS